MERISKKLEKSILERCCETPTGVLSIPNDLIKRVKKEAGSSEENWVTRDKIQRFVNQIMDK